MKTALDNACGLHSPRSAIHRAIVYSDIECIRGLFTDNKASSEIFCFGDGNNCFILAAEMYSSSEGANRDSYWNLLDTMLKLDPRGIHAKSEKGSSLLMYFCNEVDKINYLVALGADVNAKDYDGNSVLHKTLVGFNSKAFKLLLSYGATPSRHFWNVLVNKGNGQIQEATCAVIEIFQHPKMLDMDLSTLKKNPLHLLCHVNMKSCTFLNGFKSALQNLCLSNSIKQEASITVSAVPIESGDPTWDSLNRALSLLRTPLSEPVKLPTEFKLNAVGAFLFHLHLMDMSEENVDVVAHCLEIMIEHNLTANVTNKEVLHPLHALAYNIFRSFGKVQWEVYVNWTIIMSHLLYKCMTKLQGLQFHHMLLPCKVTPHIDILILITPLMVSADDQLMECVMALLQLNPLHPYQLSPLLERYRFYLGVVVHYQQFDSIFVPNLVCKILDSCGAMTVSGLDMYVHRTSRFYKSLDICLSNETNKNKAIEQILNQTLLKKDEVSSLKFLAAMNIRKTMFRNRKDTSTPLPHVIRSLFTDRILPNTLEREMLVYKPNKNLKF